MYVKVEKNREKRLVGQKKKSSGIHMENNDENMTEQEYASHTADTIRDNRTIQKRNRQLTVPVLMPVIQKKGWTWNGVSWDPDSGSRLPQPAIRGSAVGARLVTGDAETADDVVTDCPDTPLSVSAYNRGRSYAVLNFSFAGEAAHSSNHVHLHPKTRLREMADAGATAAQLHEVRRLWGI